MTEFTPRAAPRKPGLGRSFSVVMITWIVLTLVLGIACAVMTQIALETPSTDVGRGRRLRALELMGYVVRGEYVVDDGALTAARWLLALAVLVGFSFLPYAIVAALRAARRDEAARQSDGVSGGRS